MPVLNVGGRRIRVDDSFLSMSPEQQNAAVEEIMTSLGGEISDEIVPRESRGPLPAPTAGALAPEPATPPSLPAPSAGQGPAPSEDPFERAALRTARAVRPPQGRTEGTVTAAITGVPGAVYGELERQNEMARRAFENPSPENVLPAALGALPVAPVSRGMTKIMSDLALTPEQKAARAIGIESIPKVADSGTTMQAVGKVLSGIPAIGRPLRKSAERASEELQAVGQRAAALPTGAEVAQDVAGAKVKSGVVSAFSEAETVPGWAKQILRKSDEDAIGAIVRMASEAKAGANVRQLVQLRKIVPVEDQPAVQSAIISRLGRSAKTGEFEAEQWIKGYGNLSERGKNILFGQGGLRQHLDSIEAVSRRAPTWEQFGKERGMLRTPRLGPLSLLSAGVIGYTTGPLGLLGTVIPMRQLAKSLSKPGPAASVAAWGRSLESLVRSRGGPTALAKFKLATRNLSNTLGQDFDWTDFVKGGSNEQPVE